MGLFGKKESAAAVRDKEAAVLARLQAEQRDSDSRTCYRHLEAQFQLKAQGVMLKVYLMNFKRMNELFGFAYCEELLERIVDYLEQETGCRVYRYVGVEFIIILKDRTQGDAIRMTERILERFEHGWKIGDTDCICSVQAGICSYPGYADNAEDMLKCLDLAVTQAAEAGNNQYAVYDSKLHGQYLRRQAIAQYLGTALAKNEIEVRYRPTYDCASSRFTRAEYYMRVFVQGIGMVGSAEFIPIAEDTGQIRALDYYALDCVAAKIAELLEAGKNFDSIALAISPVILLQEDFIEHVASVIQKYQIPAGKLAVEVDEYAINSVYANLVVLMQELSDLGVELILNNFGSGYSGISQALELPVDTLKFDRMFIWQLETNPQSEAVIEGLAGIAAKVGKRLIAEGVETMRQVEALDRFGCGLRQGFYYSPTVPGEALGEILDTELGKARRVIDQEREKLKR